MLFKALMSPAYQPMPIALRFEIQKPPEDSRAAGHKIRKRFKTFNDLPRDTARRRSITAWEVVEKVQVYRKT